MSVIVQATYSREELMAITAARALKDRQIVFVGIGLPNLACNLARKTHAPQLELVYEAGIFGAVPSRLPLSIGDPCLVSGATAVCPLADIFLFYLQRGLIDVGFLSAAQIDRYGNINTTVIGDYRNPRVRLPGSGGACEIALLVGEVFVIARQTARTFVDRVDFVTSPGFRSGRRPPGSHGKGPVLVMTDLATYGFDERLGEMRIRTLHPGVTYADVQAATGWPIPPPEHLDCTREPTADELRILRTEIDGAGLYLTGTV
jgi:glutaconate CoA-transferase, subunit B